MDVSAPQVTIPIAASISHLQVVMYVGGLVVSAFVAGAAVTAKIKTAFNNAIKGVEDDMKVLTHRVETIEKSYITKIDAVENTAKLKEVHDKDMDKMFSFVTELREVIQEGFNTLSKRIDCLYAPRVEKQ